MLVCKGIRKSVRYLHINCYGCFQFAKIYPTVRRLHSLERFERKKFFHPFKRKKKIEKPTEINDPKLYMRDTIRSISNVLRYSTWDSAQKQLEKLSVKWDSYTVNQVLKTHPPMEKAWLFFNWASRVRGFKHDQFTYTTMLDIFGEAGRISSMKFVLKEMEEKGVIIDTVTCTAVLHWLSKDGDLEGCLKMWEEMKGKGCCPTVVSYTAFMKILFDNNMVKEATDVYKEMLESGCAPNCHTYTVLMEYLARAGKVAAALEILSKMQVAGVQPDKATCNILVQRCSKAGETWAMTHVLQYMKENSLVLRRPVYLEALKVLKIAGASDQLLREVNLHLSFAEIDDEGKSQSGLNSDDVQIIIDNGIVSYLLAKRNFIAVEHVLNGLTYKNIKLDSKIISTIIRATCAYHRPTSALLAFKYGVIVGVDIERSACLALIGFFIRTNSSSELVEVVEELIGAGISLGSYLASTLIYKLGCTQQYGSAERIFLSLPDDQKDCATYTALMGAYFCSRKVDKGLELFDIMKKKGIHSSSGTYRTLILGLEEAGRVHEAEFYKKEKNRLGHYRETESVEGLCNILFAGCVAF